MNSLSSELAAFLKAEFAHPDPSTAAAYESAADALSLPRDCTLTVICMQSIAPSYEDENQAKEIDNVLWSHAYGGYASSLAWVRDALGATETQYPLTSFESEYGYVYDRTTDHVFDVQFGESARRFEQGALEARWKNLDLFFKWFFGL